MAALDRFGGLAAGPMQPGADVFGGGQRLLTGFDGRLMADGATVTVW